MELSLGDMSGILPDPQLSTLMGKYQILSVYLMVLGAVKRCDR
jgi:hypothetical protein